MGPEAEAAEPMNAQEKRVFAPYLEKAQKAVEI
jgi:hypothetical protein